MPSCKNFCNMLAGVIFTYQTPKIVTVRSLKIGLFNRFVQIVIISYIIGYAIIYKKGYQETDIAQSNVVAKVKGIATTKNRTDLPLSYRRIWDTPDYVIPPQENGAFFVMTNAIITINQTQGICQEDSTLGNCTDSSSCPPGGMANNGNGIYTGNCKKFDINGTTDVNTCEIEAWCPVEHDKLIIPDKPLLPEACNFTVLIKNSIEFSKFEVKRRNVIDKINNETYLRNCHYNEKNDPYCPVFQLGHIVESAKANFTNLAITGGIINIMISWSCNLDFDADYCTPSYTFSRLDDADVKLAPGWNFRYANYYHLPDGTQARDMIKAYGILFIVTVEGKAGKFNLVPLILNIGAGLAILSLATIICDIILLYCVNKRAFYSGKKYLNVVDEDFAKFNTADINESDNIVGNGNDSIFE